MKLQTELTAVILGCVALNLILALAAISLFLRMGPAIERILLRNDSTIVACEEILEVMARTEDAGVTDADRDHIDAAIRRTRDNITEEGEGPAIEAIAEGVGPALGGDADARRALVDDLHDLIAINRGAMRSADQEAHRLGRAGAWVAAFVGLASLALSLFLCRGLGARIVRPILELRQVLVAAQTGDPFRRCAIRRAPPELKDTLNGVNQILDSRAREHDPDGVAAAAGKDGDRRPSAFGTDEV